MKKRWLIGAGVALLSGSLAFGISAQEGKGWSGRDGGRWRQEQFAQKLNLTAAQQQKWDAAEKEFNTKNKDFLDKSRQTMLDLRAARDAGDQVKADKLKPVVQEQRAKMKSLRDAQNAKLMTILDAKQKAEFQKMLDERAQQQRGGGRWQ